MKYSKLRKFLLALSVPIKLKNFQILIQKDFYPQFTEEAGTCLKILENLEFSTSNSAIMYTFEACIRAVIGENHEFKNLRILKKV